MFGVNIKSIWNRNPEPVCAEHVGSHLSYHAVTLVCFKKPTHQPPDLKQLLGFFPPNHIEVEKNHGHWKMAQLHIDRVMGLPNHFLYEGL